MRKILILFVFISLYFFTFTISGMCGEPFLHPNSVRFESDNGKFEIIYLNSYQKALFYKNGNPSVLLGTFSVSGKFWPEFYISNDGRYICKLTFGIINAYTPGINNSADLSTLNECQIFEVSDNGKEFKTLTNEIDYPADPDDYLWFQCGFSKDENFFVLQSRGKFHVSKGVYAFNRLFNLVNHLWSKKQGVVPDFYKNKNSDELVEWRDFKDALLTPGLKMSDNFRQAIKMLTRSNEYSFDGKNWKVEHGRVWIPGGRHYLSHHEEDITLNGVRCMISQNGFNFLLSQYEMDPLNIYRRNGILDTNFNPSKFTQKAELLVKEIKQIQKAMLSGKKIRIDLEIQLNIDQNNGTYFLKPLNSFSKLVVPVIFVLKKDGTHYKKGYSLEDGIRSLSK